MKNLKIAALPLAGYRGPAHPAVVLLALLALGGCATTTETISRDPESDAVVLKKEASYGTEYTIHLFKKSPSSVTKKVTVSPPVVMEKDMETKKIPDATEKAAAEAVYASLKEELAGKGILAEKGDGDALSFNLRVHYVSVPFMHIPREYFGDRVGWMTGDRGVGGQVLVTRSNLKEGLTDIALINSIDNEGHMFSYRRLTNRTSLELATQIEKILKEGVTIGESSK